MTTPQAITLCETLYTTAKKIYAPSMNKERLPVLSCIRISQSEDKLALTRIGHDDEGSFVPVTEYAAARFDGEFTGTCVPARAFVDWLAVTSKKQGKVLDDRILRMDVDHKRELLHIFVGNSHAVFKCISIDEFPVFL